MTHCSSLPDLSPSDFFLFPFVKNKLCGERFSIPEEAVEANWFLRMQMYVELKGEVC